jgi:hypothetical protein
VAPLVWERLGNVDNAIEPFCGSAAFLLARPHPPRIETLNDVNCYVANFWRATVADPEAVAMYADMPVNECDLHANHRWLVLSDHAAEFRRRMRTDPDHFDAKVAGRWVHGACCWIGSGWCDTPESAEWDQKPSLRYGFDYAGGGVHMEKIPSEQRPQLTGARHYGGLGVHADRIPSDGHRPQLADAYGPGRGVHSGSGGLSQAMPMIAKPGGGIGVHVAETAGTCAQRRAWLVDWFSRLRDRLRTVRVCCGDFLRVCDSDSVTTRLGLTGIFFDAPYRTTLADGSENRAGGLYAADDRANDVVNRVIAYCLERGGNPLMRIVAASYEGEGYEVLRDHGWECIAWTASGGYGNRSEKGRANARRERLWVSPHCIKPGDDLPLFRKEDA